jgi:acyl phosphate:glycerol-3-phosphate acyltransferase
MIPGQLFFAFSVAAFLCGAFPTAYVLAKVWKKTDIREHGSGNVGATNAFRVMGKGGGMLVFAVDFLKGFLPVTAFKIYSPGAPPDLVLWVGAAAVLGHVFTPFLGFKGGKGIATGAGILTAAMPGLFLMAMPVFIVVFLATRMVSMASLSAVGAIVLIATYLRFVSHALNFKSVITLFAIFCLLVWTHRTNISRILEGKEGKL